MFSDRDIDWANDLAMRERDSGVRAASSALGEDGSKDCRDCGEAISAKRKAAIPSARRCSTCQTERELMIKVGR